MQSVCVLSAHLQVRIGCPPIGLTIGNISVQPQNLQTHRFAEKKPLNRQKIRTARNISSLPALDAAQCGQFRHLPCCCERNAPAISNEMPKEKVFRRKGTLRL